MSQISSMFGNAPGLTTVVETYEAAVTFGIAAQLKWFGGLISSAATDSTNSPTWRLRPGLLMGVITASGQWTNYSPTATDGSQVARGVLGYGMRLQDVITGSNTTKFYAICIGGNVKAANLINLDLWARAQLSARFTFDDNILGNQWYPAPNILAKTSDYTIVASDNMTEFTNAGAAGTVNFTLPTLANGYMFRFRVVADQTLTVTSAAGNDIVTYNDAAASSLSFGTGSQKIGGGLMLYSNPAGTAWYSSNLSSGANTITVV